MQRCSPSLLRVLVRGPHPLAASLGAPSERGMHHITGHDSASKTVILNNGKEMPTLGLGTWKMKSKEAEDAVRTAIDLGYRHIDTAWIYQNEDGVGRAIKAKIDEGTVKREELFVTTKLWSTFHRPTSVMPALKESLSKLGLSYVDLYLVHWPMAFQDGNNPMPLGPDKKVIPAGQGLDYLDTWKGMEEAVEEGLTKSIGVSNFNSVQLSRLLHEANVKPVTNQVEAHAYFPQTKLNDFCLGQHIFLTAYSPLGSSDRPGAKKTDPVVLDDPVIKGLAVKYGATPAQICIRFLLQQRLLPIPKSVNPGRLEENLKSFNFELTTHDVAEILKLDKGKHGRLITFDVTDTHHNYPFAQKEDASAAELQL
ncbi:unnamed protein product [Cyprideis torosa]|uniref:NADP-dependent oxidoreductase domain-containing protein n=1 Tax=Cyprideis torosa TaxID=163714 RepID=A0A7R8WAH8_9CRUS|nr:unnamed protein product [Cyprideis torosa]CAG0885480.1 unnamed protein product [Cyprideis torosa]